ncbi:MAG: hypothetical protein JW783_14415 [Bacteroidales bacterium]|nr:hypothetical protein [Bacteroidales bacterium]MBN2748402.1 hypothetical protein [Bacteroidales bacterium]
MLQVLKDKKNGILLVSTILFIILALLNFRVTISTGGDDSWYIIAARNFVNQKSFPAWHGALYPLVLSPLILAFGINIILFKLISIALTALGIYLTGYVWKSRVNPWIWLWAVILGALNTQTHLLASTTYSEPLFILMQALTFWAFFRVDTLDLTGGLNREHTISFALLGLTLFLLGLTRNIGHGATIAVLLYFICTQSFKKGTYTLLALLLFQVPFSLYKRVAWRAQNIGFESQLKAMLYKDFYHPDQGTENAVGLFIRFWQNALQYISKHLVEFFTGGVVQISQPSVMVTLILIALFVTTLVIAIRQKQRSILLLGLYLAITIAGTFVTQQVSWNQGRLMLVYLPLLTIFLGYGADTLIRSSIARVFRKPLLIVLISLCAITNLKSSLHSVDLMTLKENLSGDKYCGFSPDWQNYLKLCSWVGKHVSPSEVVACRKPNMAEIYANRSFKGIYKIPSKHPDTLQANLNKEGIAYVVVGSLRTDPTANSGSIIQTVRNTLKILLQKYPLSIEYLRTEGNSEPAYLFRLHINNDPSSTKEAEQRLLSGLMIYPDNPNALYSIGQLYFSQKQYDKSLKYLLQGLKVVSSSPELLELAGANYALLENHQQAAACFQTLTKLYPANGNYWYNLGVCYANMRKPEAQRLMQKGVELGAQRNM